MLGSDLEFAFIRLCLDKPSLWDYNFSPIDPLAVDLVEKVLRFRGEYHQYPNYITVMEYVKDEYDVQQFELIEQYLSADLNEKFVENKIIKYLEEHGIRQAIHECAELLEDGKIKQAKARLFEGVISGGVMPYNYFSGKYMENKEEVIPTGLYVLDKALKVGGLCRRKLGLVCGPRSSGKSVVLLNFGVGALYHGYRVFHVTLEDSLGSVIKRYNSRLKGFGTRPVEKVKELYNGELYIKEFMTGEATIADIDACAMQITPDVILIDYLDEVRPSKDYKARRHELGDVARGARALAQRHNCGVWIAKQTGRQTKFSSDITTSESSFEGYEPVQIADVSVVINQTIEENNAGTARLLVDKNKDGPVPISIKIETDWSRMLIRVK